MAQQGNFYLPVRAHIQIRVGLRPNLALHRFFQVLVRAHIQIRVGLRLQPTGREAHHLQVRAHIQIRVGLRQKSLRRFHAVYAVVRAHIQIRVGLRPDEGTDVECKTAQSQSAYPDQSRMNEAKCCLLQGRVGSPTLRPAV